MRSAIFKTNDLSSNDRVRIEKRKSIEKLEKISTGNLNEVRNSDGCWASKGYYFLTKEQEN